MQEVTEGVPHGSILGPLLFTLYINNLSDNTNKSVQVYADDSTIMASDKSVAMLDNKLTENIKQMESGWIKINYHYIVAKQKHS